MTLIRDANVTSFPPSNLSAFGVLQIADRTPSFQGDFVYGLNTQMWKYYYVFTVTAPVTPPVYGDIYTNNNKAFVIVYISGTTLFATGYGNPAASGNLTRVTGVGSTPIIFSAYTTQAGVTFGTGAAVDTNASRMRIQSGTSATGYAYEESRRVARYRAGEGMELVYTPIFTAGVADNVQLWGVGAIHDNAPYDGYFFGYNGVDFGIAHYNRGTPTWKKRATEWNGDKCDGSGPSGFSYNPTLGTPAMIKYPYLGYGDITFYLQDSDTGKWILCHTIKYANASATTQVSNPSLYFAGYTKNSGNTSPIIMYCGSVGVFVSGLRSYIGNPKGAADNNKSGITVETAIFTVRNCVSYNGTPNRGTLRLHSISAVVTANISSVVVVRIRINAAVGGTSAFTPYSGSTADNGVSITAGNSIASVDTAGTTTSGGFFIYNFSLSAGKDGSGGGIIDISPYEIFLSPGEDATVSVFSTNNAVASVSLNWSEDI